MSEDVDKLRREVEKLRNELKQVKERKNGDAREKDEKEIQDRIENAAGNKGGLSRRDFLKVLGGGTAAAGAMAMLPSASAFTFKDNESFKFGNLSSSQTNFEVGTSGGLDLHGNSISNVGVAGINSVDSEKINNVVYASEFNGAGLASKVENAIDWLSSNVGGRGTVRITPPDDGSVWTWDKSITIDHTTNTGIHIDVAGGIEIEYPGDGVAITIDGSVDDQYRPRISGGRWTASGNPDGWLRIKDLYGMIIEPNTVSGFENGDTDAFCVSIENHGEWSESTRIRDCLLQGDRAVQFKTASETGGSGTSSFHETRMDHATFKGNDYCIKTKGNMDYSSLDNCTFRPGADGANCLFFAHDFMRGGMMNACKFEDAGNLSNTTGIVEKTEGNGGNGDSMFYGPLVMEAQFGNIDTEWDTFGSAHNVSASGGKFVKVDGVGFNSDRAFTCNVNKGEFEITDSSGTVTLKVNSGGELVAVNDNGTETTLT